MDKRPAEAIGISGSFGGDGEGRTRVQKYIRENFSERSLCLIYSLLSGLKGKS